jgi:hypothetical protein
MNCLFVIPTIASVLFCIVKFLERRYLIEPDNLEKFALKLIARDVIIIFSVTLFANFVYTNTEAQIDNFFSVITNTKGIHINRIAEIYTDSPNF